MFGSNNQDFRTIPHLWPEVRGKRSLDIGCGIGLYTQELARRGSRCFGLDLEWRNIFEAKHRSGGEKIYWIRGDAAHLPFREDSFDLVVSVEVLTHIPPEMRMAALREVSRVIRHGGKAFITLHNRVRLSASRWLRLQRPQVVYRTPNLSVWPTVPYEAREMALACDLREVPSVAYLNYHSRFTYQFYCRHPNWSSLVIWVEDLLSRLPLLRLLAITFLLSLRKNS